MATGSSSKAIAKRDGALQLDETSSKMMAVAHALAKSMAVPQNYRGRPDEIFATIQMGREFGLGPMTSLNNISNIQGKPTMSIHMLIGLCQKHPEYAGHSILKSTTESCEVLVRRKSRITGEIMDFKNSFSIAEAKTAGLWKAGGAWQTYPRNMCKARALAFAFRDAFADSISGTYTLEEMDSESYAASVIEAEAKFDDAIANEKAVVADGTVIAPKRKPVAARASSRKS